MPVRIDIRLPMEGGCSCPTVAGTNAQNRPWFGFMDAIGPDEAGIGSNR